MRRLLLAACDRAYHRLRMWHLALGPYLRAHEPHVETAAGFCSAMALFVTAKALAWLALRVHAIRLRLCAGPA